MNSGLLIVEGFIINCEWWESNDV